MKTITLAKARKLDKEIGNILNVPTKTNFKISKFKSSENLKSEYVENLTAFNTAYMNILNLCKFKFKLRLQIQKINNIEIDDLLNFRQRLSAQITIMSNIVYAVDDSVELGSSDMNIIESKMKKESDNTYHNVDTVDYTVIDRNMINATEDSITIFRSELSEIDDKLLRLNNSNFIELSDETLTLLNDFKIIV